MKELVLKTDIYHFNTCCEFVNEFKFNSSDLILTNDYIYNPFFDNFNLSATVIFQEKYGSGEPSDVMVDAILRDIRNYNPKRIIAIGGGTIIDIAKILAVSDRESVDSLFENKEYIEKKRQLIIIPTTCGTGSEVTNISIINRLQKGTKMGLASDHMFADSAILIPELLTTLPYYVFATSSIDALVHAVESALSPKATPYSKLFSYKAIDMIINSYKKLVSDGNDVLPGLLSDFLIASNYAGIAFGTAGCGTVHAMSYPLGGTYHVPHGESNYAIFTGVLRTYKECNDSGEMLTLQQSLGELLDCSAHEAINELDKLLEGVLPKKALKDYGLVEDDILQFAQSVIDGQQRLLSNSFIPMNINLVKKIYTELY
ncbi:4-hydroxybutyrate dehydrogenase [Tyzzerella sp. OttesenSCG-928-J15]|nr:4-hydroxybutyrate dehydrogenase [Tyzzerella sp. OttesenSCG-928-J15]